MSCECSTVVTDFEMGCLFVICHRVPGLYPSKSSLKFKEDNNNETAHSLSPLSTYQQCLKANIHSVPEDVHSAALLRVFGTTDIDHPSQKALNDILLGIRNLGEKGTSHNQFDDPVQASYLEEDDIEPDDLLYVVPSYSDWDLVQASFPVEDDTEPEDLLYAVPSYSDWVLVQTSFPAGNDTEPDDLLYVVPSYSDWGFVQTPHPEGNETEPEDLFYVVPSYSDWGPCSDQVSYYPTSFWVDWDPSPHTPLGLGDQIAPTPIKDEFSLSKDEPAEENDSQLIRSEYLYEHSALHWQYHLPTRKWVREQGLNEPLDGDDTFQLPPAPPSHNPESSYEGQRLQSESWFHKHLSVSGDMDL